MLVFTLYSNNISRFVKYWVEIISWKTRFVKLSFLDLIWNIQGAYRKIYVDSSASLQLTGFYDEVATPLLYNIDISYTDNAIDVDSVTPTNFISYFQGTEIVVAGKLSNEIDVLSASVLASSRMDSELEMNVSANTMVRLSKCWRSQSNFRCANVLRSRNQKFIFCL